MLCSMEGDLLDLFENVVGEDLEVVLNLLFLHVRIEHSQHLIAIRPYPIFILHILLFLFLIPQFGQPCQQLTNQLSYFFQKGISL